jgi:iron complex transport system permease protein
MLSGGALLALADTAARSFWAPLQVPVGALTALLGVPVVLLLLAGRA